MERAYHIRSLFLEACILRISSLLHREKAKYPVTDQFPSIKKLGARCLVEADLWIMVSDLLLSRPHNRWQTGKAMDNGEGLLGNAG